MKRTSFLAVAATMALLGFAAPASATHVACGATITVDTTLDSDVCVRAPPTRPPHRGRQRHAAHGRLRSPLAGSGWVRRHLPGGSGQNLLGSADQRRHRRRRIEGFDSGVLLETTDSFAQRLTVTSNAGGIELRGDRNSALLNDVTMTR